ncbi:MAG: hypothetical protein HC880_08985 [Bacteroidia bacterium]|nr:hypothetical protein [Bacteroidia bacterium]
MKTQRITFIVLMVVAVLLSLEFFSKRRTLRASKKENVAKAVAAADTAKKTPAADSIAALYAPVVFRDKQKEFDRVKKAYQEKYKIIKEVYEQQKNLIRNPFICI